MFPFSSRLKTYLEPNGQIFDKIILSWFNIAVAFLGEDQQSRQAWEVEALDVRNFNNSLIRFRFRENN